MLRTDVIALLNTGRAWALVGSGASVDGGGPTWAALVKDVVGGLPATARSTLERDAPYRNAMERGQFSRCFGRIEATVGRGALEAAVRFRLGTLNGRSPITDWLAQMPFEGYINLNHDGLLLRGLRSADPGAGWLSVGNTSEEVAKLSGDPSHLVWHAHGGVDLPEERSRLVLTPADYDATYRDGSPVLEALKSLLWQRRIVVVGFGFEDPELLRVLRAVGQIATPARPVIAFLSETKEREASDLLRDYNVDAVTYRAPGPTHRELPELLRGYSAFVLKRSQKYGQQARPCPSYEPQTTGLRLYNALTQGRLPVPKEVQEFLMRAHVLTVLHTARSVRVGEMVAYLEARSETLGVSSPGRVHRRLVEGVFQHLSDSGLISREGGRGARRIVITAKADKLVGDHAGAAQLAAERFSSSLEGRAMHLLEGDPVAASRVAVAAESFFKDCVTRRSLGLAMAAAHKTERQDYHMVGLLQSLPEFMGQLESATEAVKLSQIVQDVLARPIEPESQYIGLALQAAFGSHLLGLHPDTVAARLGYLTDTTFLIDSSTLIPYLAEDCPGHDAARFLVDKLHDLGCIVATTPMISEEVAEHARWAAAKFASDTGLVSLDTLRAATGRTDQTDNAFLLGYLAQMATGTKPVARVFGEYIGDCIGRVNVSRLTEPDVTGVLRDRGLDVRLPSEWPGFDMQMHPEIDEREAQLKAERVANGTFRHDRQVRAEAEVMVLIAGLRRGALSLDGSSPRDAYFISRTRTIDTVSRPGRPITLTADGVTNWIGTLVAAPSEDLGFLTTNLFGELAERGLSIIDRRQLEFAFGSFISAAQEQLDDELKDHASHITDLYGVGADIGFRQIAPLDLPLALESFHAQRARQLENELKVAKAARRDAEARAAVTGKDADELARLRAEKKARQQKGLKAQRRGASRSPKRGKH